MLDIEWTYDDLSKPINCLLDYPDSVYNKGFECGENSFLAAKKPKLKLFTSQVFKYTIYYSTLK
jgi:hypothetical protein